MNTRTIFLFIFLAFALGFAAHILVTSAYPNQTLFAASLFERWFPSLYLTQRIFNIQLLLLNEYKKGAIQIHFTKIEKGVDVLFISDKPDLAKSIKDSAAEIEDALKKIK